MLTKLNKLKIELMKANKVKKTEENVYKINIINDVLTEVKSTAVNKKIADVSLLSKQEIVKVIEKVSKQLDKEIEGLKNANRETKKPEIQKEFLNQFIPKKASLLETEQYVRELVTLGKTLPEIMKHSKDFAELFDLSLVSKIAREQLSK